jgi:putative ABC transport system permease protein
MILRPLIRMLVLLYPRSFRERYGDALLAFHDERAAAGISLREWPRILMDHVASAAREHVRAMHDRAAGAAVQGLAQDARYAWHTLVRRPFFTTGVLATIALGVGANAAIFSVVYGVLLRPLPWPDADRLVTFGHEAPVWLASAPEYVDYRNALRSFEGLSAYTRAEGNLGGEGDPERIALANVTLDFFDVMGVSPRSGRGFGGDDDVSMPSNVVVISHALWQRRLGGHPHVVGSELVLNGRPRTIIGIMPPNFDYPMSTTDVWLPLPRMRPDSLGDRANHSLFMVGRLRPGITVEAALAEARSFAQRMVAANTGSYDPAAPAVPVIDAVAENLLGNTRPYLFALFGAVTLILLIVCANVANLLLARGSERRSEIAVRAALGASHARLLRQLLIESLMLSFGGGLLGVLLAAAAVRGIIAAAPPGMPRLDEVGIDWRVLAFAFATSLAAGLIFGVLPATRVARDPAGDALRRAGRNFRAASSSRVRRAIIAAEVALAVVILSGATMLLRSLVNLQQMDMGFEPQRVLTVEVSPASSYTEERATLFYTELLARVRALPGVEHAGAAGWLPVVDAGGLWGILAEGQDYSNIERGSSAVPQQVTPGAFAALGIRMLEGRDFTVDDRGDGPYVVIVSKSMARMMWGDTSPLGRRFRLGGNQVLMTVVGVVEDIRARGFTDTPEPTMYFPHAQTGKSAYFMPRSLSLVVRTTGNPLDVVDDVRRIVRELDAGVPVSSIRTLEDVVGSSIADRRFSTALIGSFAVLALLIAGIGIFGVVSCGVAERTFEIGLRMALGAQRSNALELVLRDSLAMTAAGLVTGLAAAAILARLIRSLLYGVAPSDIATLIGTVSILTAVVIIATILPARRAMSVNPASTLNG